MRLSLLIALAVLTAPRFTQADDLARDGASAVPALDRVGVAQSLELGWSFAAGSSYGFTESVLADSDAHHRLSSSIAASYRPWTWLAAGARYDGRYDRHSDDPITQTDDGWIGQPTLFGRAVVLQRPRLSIATELDVWFPHDGGFGLSANAISADALAIASVRAGRSVVLTAHAGGRIDRSANSADEADRLSPSDRMALGVSDSHAALLGAGLLWRGGPTEVYGEWTWDLLVGDDAPRVRESPMRIAAGVRWSATRSIVIGGAVQASIAARPDLAMDDPLVPVEPLLRVAATVSYRFDDTDPASGPLTDGDIVAKPPPEPPRGTVRGRLTDATGDPISGLAITVTAGDRRVETTTNADGAFEVGDLPPGVATVSAVEQPPYGAFEQTATVGAEPADLAIEVDRVYPAGQIRGVVRTPGGKALQAAVRVDALGVTVQTDAEGRFRFEIAPGKHEIEIEAEGRVRQRKSVRVEQDGVTILNVELYPNEQ